METLNYNRKEKKKLNNCVNIFEVIKLLILFYSWKVFNNNNNDDDDDDDDDVGVEWLSKCHLFSIFYYHTDLCIQK